ncbi:MAG: hypothetical protein WAZ27_02375 [Minisyncoccia bacterium]
MEGFRNLVDATQILQDIRDEKIEGRKALAKLAETKQFLFHGSPNQLEVLEPRQAISYGEPHGAPAVSAASHKAYDLAIFMALIKSAKNQPKRPRGSRTSGFSMEGEYNFRANALAYEDATSTDAYGYVYVFPIKDFKEFAEHEWRSENSVRPVLAVRVTAKDFPSGVQIEEDEQ